MMKPFNDRMRELTHDEVFMDQIKKLIDDRISELLEVKLKAVNEKIKHLIEVMEKKE